MSEMSFEQKRDHEKEVAEFLKQQENEAREQRRQQDNEKAKDRMKNLRHERSMEQAEEEGLLSRKSMCMIHDDLPASFALQHANILKGLPQRISLCPMCASKLRVNKLSTPRGECINEEFHIQNPRFAKKGVAELEHNNLFGEVPALPLCKVCSSSFALQMRPLNEEADKFEFMVPMLSNKEAVLKSLLRAANSLDQKGLYQEANELDDIIEQIAGE